MPNQDPLGKGRELMNFFWTAFVTYCVAVVLVTPFYFFIREDIMEIIMWSLIGLAMLSLALTFFVLIAFPVFYEIRQYFREKKENKKLLIAHISNWS